MDWNAYNVKGTRETVKQKIAGDAKLPDHVKAFLFCEIDLIPDTAVLVTVNAYGQSHGPTRNIQITLAAVHP